MLSQEISVAEAMQQPEVEATETEDASQWKRKIVRIHMEESDDDVDVDFDQNPQISAAQSSMGDEFKIGMSLAEQKSTSDNSDFENEPTSSLVQASIEEEYSQVSKAEKKKRLQTLALRKRMENAIKEEQELAEERNRPADLNLSPQTLLESPKSTLSSHSLSLSEPKSANITSSDGKTKEESAQEVLERALNFDTVEQGVKKPVKLSKAKQLEIEKTNQRLILETEARLEVKIANKRDLSELVTQFLRETEISSTKELSDEKMEVTEIAHEFIQKTETETMFTSKWSTKEKSVSKYHLNFRRFSSDSDSDLEIVQESTTMTRKEMAVSILQPKHIQKPKQEKKVVVDRRQLYLEAKRLDGLKYRPAFPTQSTDATETETKGAATEKSLEPPEASHETNQQEDEQVKMEEPPAKELDDGSESEAEASFSDSDETTDSGSESEAADTEDSEQSGDEDETAIVPRNRRRKVGVTVEDEEDILSDSAEDLSKPEMDDVDRLWESGFASTMAVPSLLSVNPAEESKNSKPLVLAMFDKMKSKSVKEATKMEVKSSPQVSVNDIELTATDSCVDEKMIDDSLENVSLEFDVNELESEDELSHQSAAIVQPTDSPMSTYSISESQREDLVLHEKKLAMLDFDASQVELGQSAVMTKKQKKLIRFKDLEEEDEEDKENTVTAVKDINSELMRLAQLHKNPDAMPKMKTDFVEEEADVEDDEYQNAGGADGEGNAEFDRVLREELAEFIDEDVEKVLAMTEEELMARLKEEESLREFFNKQQQEDDMKMTKALAKDIATGRILDRRKHRSTAGGNLTEMERAKFGRTEEEEELDDPSSLKELDDVVDYGVFGDIIAKYIENRRKQQASLRKRKRNDAALKEDPAVGGQSNANEDDEDFDWTNEGHSAPGGLQIAPGLFIETDLDRLTERVKRHQAMQRAVESSTVVTKVKEDQTNRYILNLIRGPKKMKASTTPPARTKILTSFHEDPIAPSPLSSASKQSLAARMKSIHVHVGPERKTTAFQVGISKSTEVAVHSVSATPVKALPAAAHHPKPDFKLRQLLQGGF